MRFALPGVLWGISQSVPAHRKISELQNRRVKLHGLVESNDFGIFVRAITGTDELPAMIIGIMRDVKNRFLALKHLPCRKYRTVLRLIKWP